jgi:hypothetical protein
LPVEKILAYFEKHPEKFRKDLDAGNIIYNEK